MKLLLFPIFYPRFAVFVVAIAFYVFFASQAKAVELKRNALIEGPVITLGDIFYDLPSNEDKVLGPAPRPGKDMILNARTLLRVAIALDLNWRPATSNEHIVLKRAATLISKDDIEKSLITDIRKDGYQGDFELDFPAQTSEIILPADQAAVFEIDGLSVDNQNERFTATIYAPTKEDPLQTLNISGAIYSVVKVPVLSQAMRNGSIIRENDLDYIAIRTKDLNHDVILKAENLIGMTPRRMALNGKPLTDNEIQAPQIVERGQTVTMIFNSGAIQLTAMGRALESGAKGDMIRVVNANSSRNVQAVISGEQEVQVQSF